MALQGFSQFTTARGLAGLSLADSYCFFGRGRSAQIFVETDNATDLRMADIENVGNQRLCLIIDVAFLGDNCTQGRDGSTGSILKLFDQISNA